MSSNDGSLRGNGRSRGNNDDSDEYKKMKASLEGRMEKKDEEILKIEANVFQLANYYLVFQGVILNSIFKDSSSAGTIACKYIWVPLSLSIIAGILNLGALLIMGHKYKESLKLLDDIAEVLLGHISQAREAHGVGIPTSSSDTLATSIAERLLREVKKRHKMEESRRTCFFGLSMTLLILFGLLNVAAIVIIPCA